MAAGLSLAKENLPGLRRRLNENCTLTEEDFVEKIHIDVPMPMSYVTTAFVKQLSVLEPFGNGNSKPVFAQKNISLISGRILGKNGNVGKYCAADESGRRNWQIQRFAELLFLQEHFGRTALEKLYQGGRAEGIRIHVIYYPDINVYQGRESLQMIMQDYSPA